MTCPVQPNDLVIEHEQAVIHVAEIAAGRLGASNGPCAISGINLNDYSLSLDQKGWGPHCTGPFTTVTLSSGARVTVDTRIAELVSLTMEANIRQGYSYRAADTGAYNCRYIGGTTVWSNHAWGLAVDCNWGTNPQHSPLTTDRPGWELARWNRYGFAWGGAYGPPTLPDAMHTEFMGTPAQAVAATNLARAELLNPPAPAPAPAPEPTPAPAPAPAPTPPPAVPGQLPALQRAPGTGNMEVPGFDCSYTKPGWMEMRAAGYTFVFGYVSPTPSKNLSAGNLYDYQVRAGMGVGLVWESTAGRAVTGGAAGGKADGAAAEAQANALGYPVDSVIFFAVDQDTSSANYPAIQAYANAFNMATRRPVGIYGEFDVIEHFVTPGQQPVQCGWQTAAWSGGRLSAKANVYQRVGHPGWPVPSTVAANAFDEDVAIHWLPLAGW